MFFLCSIRRRSWRWGSRLLLGCAGLSGAAFREAFGTEEQCRSALTRLCWGEGFVYPGGDHRGHCFPTRCPLDHRMGVAYCAEL